RILNSLPQKVSPGGHHQCTRNQDRRIPTGAADRLPNVPEGVLKHEAADTGAGVEHGEDEECFEHDGEVVPDCHYGLSAKAIRKNMRHAYGKSGRAAGAIEKCLFAYSVSE